MKKTLLFTFLLIFMLSSSVHALSWAYSFVVWDGKVYEVTEEKILKKDVGEAIGEVKTKPNDMTGDYYGNASNSYPKGTKYYKINNISTSAAIAVEVEENQWKKGVFVHKAPFHWMNLFTKILPILILIIVVIYLLKKRRK